MKKIIVFVILLYPTLTRAQGMFSIGQTKEYVIHDCGNFKLLKNDDTTLIYYETKDMTGIFNFKDGICYRYSQTITDAITAQTTLKALKDKGVEYQQKKLTGGNAVWDSYYQGYTIRYIPSVRNKNLWLFVYTRP
jgi:hypothetical protein